jgi:hypothetical protein
MVCRQGSNLYSVHEPAVNAGLDPDINAGMPHGDRFSR